MFGVARACWRLLRSVMHIAAGMWTILTLFPRLGQPAREARVQVWAKAMLPLAGIELVVSGVPVANGPALLVQTICPGWTLW